MERVSDEWVWGGRPPALDEVVLREKRWSAWSEKEIEDEETAVQERVPLPLGGVTGAEPVLELVVGPLSAEERFGGVAGDSLIGTRTTLRGSGMGGQGEPTGALPKTDTLEI